MNIKKFFEIINNRLPQEVIYEIDNERSLYYQRLDINGLEEMHNYSTDERFYEFLSYAPFKEIDDTKKYIQKLLSRMEKKNGEQNTIYWFVRKSSDKTLIGTACLVNIDYENRSAEIGYGIDPKYWGQGYINQIIESLKHYCFESLELNRIHGKTHSGNERVIKTVKSLGMKHEGILRSYILDHKNVFHDGWKYSMLKNEYFSFFKNDKKIKKNIDINTILSLVSKILKEDISVDSDMENTLNWDSLNHMAILLTINDELNIQFSPREVASAISIRKILELINKKS